MLLIAIRDPNMGEDGRWVPSSGGSYWPVYSPTNREYLNINTANYRRMSALRSQECHFWSSYLPQLLRKGSYIMVHLEIPLILLFQLKSQYYQRKEM